jgi:hypothetical protein
MNNLQMVELKGVWETRDGKSIPYVRQSYQLTTDDDGNDYFLLIMIWPKNTTIEISVVEKYPYFLDIDSETRCLDEKTHRIAKVTNAEFQLQKDELIEKAIEFVNAELARII